MPVGDTDAEAYLTKLCARGFYTRYGYPPEVQKHLYYAINMIPSMGFLY